MVPLLRLGAFDIPQVPGVYGTPIGEVEKGVEVDIDGVVGSGLLAYFRVTLTDGGRAMWLEDVPQLQQSAPPPGPPPPASSAAPPASSSAPPKGDKPSDKPEKPAKPKPKAKPPGDGPASTP
jgi:hypothetical protein